MSPPGPATQIFGRLLAGDRAAFDELLPLVYEELRALGQRYMREERAGHTLQATALAHEAYLRLVGHEKLELQDRAHFFAVAARAMRQILIEHARARGRKKRGGEWDRVRLNTIDLADDEPNFDVLALDIALDKLAARDPRKAQVVELLYFGGLTSKEAADVLGVTARTVERDWRAARAWLLREIFDDDAAIDAVERRDLLRPGTPPDAGARSATPATPERIGRYPIRREIARGGMGVVYEAEDDVLGRTVALKVLPARLAGDPIWLRRFEREARYLAAVDHPNIANVYTLEESDGVRFLTMELVEGPTLRDRLASGALPLPDAMSVLAQTARALETLHRQDIAHCDLKPDNVLLSEDDHVTLIDFGLARRRDDWRAGGPRSPAGDREESGSGTPGYMAPEQVEGRGVEPAADLWAFGCVAYECITGAPAFPGTTRERLDATLHETPEWERLPRELAPRVRETTLRCLEKRPEDRPAGIAEIRRVLEEELDELGRDPETPASAPVHDLPVWSNVFVGRTSHVDTLAKRLERTRLLTLTGPGGCGKTRLASFVGRRRLGAYADGVRFVGLCAARTSEQALQSIAAGCSVSVDPGADTLDALAAALTEKRLLLILDNCEHLRDACRAVCERLLDECAGITILATSREALRAASETVYVVPPLSGPGASASENPADLADVESVALFVARAAEADPDFRLTKDNVSRVARLCRRLEGLPLAIELAAAGGEVGSVAGAAPQTLSDVIAWSYDLLSAPERTFFRRLAVFAGGFSRGAAAWVCAGQDIADADVVRLLQALRRKSLVDVDVRARPLTGEVRFRLLEPVREFAASRQSSDELSALRDAHARFFTTLAEEAAPHLKGRDPVTWLSAFASEHDNLRAALDHALAPSTDPELGLRLAAALETFWTMRGHWKEAAEYANAMLRRPGADSPSVARGHVLNAAALCALNGGDPEQADRFYQEAVEIGRRTGDEPLLARSIHNQGGVALRTGRFAEARRSFETYLQMQRRRGDRSAEMMALSNLGVVADREGRLADASSLYQAGLAIAEELGHPRMTGVLLNNLGAAALLSQRWEVARGYLARALEIHRDAEDSWNVANTLNLLGAVADGEDDVATAARCFRESLRLKHEVDDADGVATLLTQIGCFEARRGSAVRCATLLAAADALRARIRAPLAPSHRAEVEGAMAVARSALGSASFRESWDHGAALDARDAVAYALEG